MKKYCTKMLRVLCGIAVMLALGAGMSAVPVLAASNGIYLATATPHYRHPVTGVIEDAGGDGSAVLGQSMTESALDRQALVEVDPEGNTYVTIRMKLMDNIENPTFQVDGSSVSASLMQEDYSVNTADFRMRVNSEDSIIRCSMYVVPMGRQVVFYITVSGLYEGSGDFITSVSVVDTPAQPTAPAEDNSQSSGGSDSVQPGQTDETAEGNENKTGETKNDAENKNDEKKDETQHTGLQEFDESGKQVTDSEKTAKNTSSANVVLYVLLGGAVVVACAAVWYFGFFRKKK